MKGKITKSAVDKLKSGNFIADSEVKGFIARRLPSGVVTYGFQYRTPDGRRPWISLGLHGRVTPDEARTLAKKRAGEVANDHDPAADRKRNGNGSTVNAVLDQYIERDVRARNLRSAHDITSSFDRLVRPRIGARSIYDLRRSDIGELLDGIQDRNGAVMADRTLAHLRAAFNWQAARDDNFVPPIVKRMARTKPKEMARDRTLDDGEIRDVWNALDQLIVGTDAPACFPRLVRALLLSGQRRSNVAEARSDQISDGQWIIPGAEMKHKRDHLVPVTAGLSDLFGQGDGFLFSSDGGKTSFSGFSKCKRALERKIAKLRKGDGRKPMPPWRLHDLRRTARSILSRYTTPDHAERVIGHVIAGVRGVYDLYEYADEKRTALEKLARHVRGIVRQAR
jgi:integrase